jgi:hypothetical protein
VLFSHSFCLYVSNFRHSDWSRTQNVNKRGDWLTLFALVAHACTRSELQGASCEDWKSALNHTTARVFADDTSVSYASDSKMSLTPN